jgi:hypothetical protein
MEVVGRAVFIALQAQVTACIPSKAAMAVEQHHRKYGFHGGTHRTENLKPVCGFATS